MSNRDPFYFARPDDTAEVQRALRICLCGMHPPAPMTFQGGEARAWAETVFLNVLAPHVIAVHGMAHRGEAGGITALDSALRLPPRSAAAGLELLTHRHGARHLPVLRRFETAVAEGKAVGHFATVLTLHAANFSIALLPLLQCLLYCECHVGQPSDAMPGMENLFPLAAAAISGSALSAPPGSSAATPRQPVLKRV